KTIGDGFLATFDGPGRGLRCSNAIADSAKSLAINVRIGMHAGEVELRNGDIGGIAVHIAQRIQALADPGDVLVSSTVKNLVAGSGFEFSDAGLHRLKGVPDEWRILRLDRRSHSI